MLDQDQTDYDDDEQDLEEEEYHVRERAKAVLLAWYHATACGPRQGCSCDLAREEYAQRPTAVLTFAATYTRRLA